MSALTLVSEALGMNQAGQQRVPPTSAELYNTPSEGRTLEPLHGEVTELLRQAASGSEEARNRLYGLILPELCRIASAKLRRERPGHSLSTTDLVHEAFLRFADQKTLQKNRAQLYGVFAMMMRRVLIDRTKKKVSARQGGGWRRVTLHSNLSLPWKQAEQMLGIHECLEKLEKENPRQGKIVELRFFGGLSNVEIADALGISLSTVEAEWRFARAWLRIELQGVSSGDESSAKGTGAEAV